MFAFTTPKQLSIDLTEPVVYLRGPPCDQITNVLRGQIVVTLSKPSVLTNIELKFVGKCRTLWPEGIGAYSRRSFDDKVLYHQTIPILLANSNPPPSSLQMDPGVYYWPFEVMIPNSLVETISCDLGMVDYRLYASVERSGMLKMNLHARRDIILIRVPDTLVLDASPESSMTIVRESEWCDWSLTVERTPVAAGTSLPVVGRVVAIQKGIRIEVFSCTISEKRTFSAPELRAVRVEEKRIRLARLDGRKSNRIGVDLDETGGVWEERVEFATPDCNDKLHHTTSFRNILVQHWVQVTLTLSMPEELTDGHENSKKKGKRVYREFLLNSPMQILSCRCLDDFVALPIYTVITGHITPEGFSCPCDDQYKHFRQEGRSIKELEFCAEGEAPPPPDYNDVIGPWNSSNIVDGRTRGSFRNIEEEHM